ncbi:lipoyltransferase 1, mitochondrial-like [Sitodiplosis mosellana]|uniref:lipoyltransferase 1, mitochondrial-like n=1 Tax=Sitodiplosis mosellana TaxID=263140 RepID=UPI0024447FAA|nr:lipoyltransferase 1, mitochondrial-like [Sitodiplosis mosellana]
MASTLFMNCGTKVRSVIGHLSPLSQQINVSVKFHPNYQSIQKAVVAHNYSTTTTTTTTLSDGKNNAISNEQVNATPTAKSTYKSRAIKAVPDNEIRKSVFISQSNDIFTNLALEDWFYRNFDFTNHHVLMLWANDPCVVIGRHQNPFDETNVSNLQKADIALARRNSGGGTVYHDRGNLNMTFFTPRERYNRTYNLNIVTRALFREWGIKADISARDDIVINDKKISGTAAKLGQPNAYHHCTLLVDTNKNNIREALVKDEAEIVTKATQSVRSPVKNLVDVNRHVNFAQLLSAVGYEFLRTSATELHDGGRHLMMKQRGFQLINPTEKWFPGLMEIRDNLNTWDWCYGKTPKFTVQKEIQLKSEEKDHNVQLNISVNAGLIEGITLIVPNYDAIPVVSTLRGTPYTEEHLNNIIMALKGVSGDNVKHAMNHSF